MNQQFVVSEDQHKERADNIACSYLPDLSRAYVQKLFADQSLLVNGKPSKSGQRLQVGDTIDVQVDLSQVEKIEDIDLPIIYQDENVAVIDKPTGVISHSRGKYWYEPSVASFMRQVSGQEGERSGIVHRLDRATSGVMVCAKNQETMKFLQKQFADRKVEKTYLAVVVGKLKQTEAIIDMPIERNPKKPQIFRVGASGKDSVTHYKTVKQGEVYSLVELRPKTGRTHQLRVHLAHLGHPIVGDSLYGGQDAIRLFLHAHAISIVLLGEDSPRKFISTTPKEFSDLVSRKVQK